jgi:hypothetical protein
VTALFAASAIVLLMNDDGLNVSGASTPVDITGMTTNTEIETAIESKFASTDEVIVTGSADIGSYLLSISIPTGKHVAWNATSFVGDGIYIYGPGSFTSAKGASLTVGALWVYDGGTVTLNNSIALSNDGEWSGADGSTLTINGNVNSTSHSVFLCALNSGTVTVNGNVTLGDGARVFANEGGKMTIKGNVIAPGGAEVFTGALIAIYGTLSVENDEYYVAFDTGWAAKGDFNDPHVGPIGGGKEYSDGLTPESFVYVEVPLPSNGGSNNTLLIVGAAIGAVAVLGAVGYFVFVRKP